MLKIFNDLRPFFEDCYRRIHVREYARIQKISPPTASQLLKILKKDGLLKVEHDKRHDSYFANKDSKVFQDLGRIYWRNRLEEIGLLKYLEDGLANPTIILFGSLAKAETLPTSDVDLAIFAPEKKALALALFEKKLNRNIQMVVFRKKEEVGNVHLLGNILNGYMLKGGWY